jgi:hypothetical protein
LGGNAAEAFSRGYGDTSGPSEAEVGDTISVRFAMPASAVSVKFEALNAVVGFVGPMAVREIAEASARMMATGSATILATGYDDQGGIAHEAAHVVQVRGGPNERPKGNLLSDIANDMERSMEARILAGLNPKR